MRCLMVILVGFILACKGTNPENTTANNEVLEQEKTSLNESQEAPAQGKTTIIDIPICELDKRDQEVYALFLKPSEMTFATELGGRLYSKSKKKAFDKLFLSDKINCIVPVSGDGYAIFDIHYKDDIAAETIYERIMELDKNQENQNTYHDFFKRGLVFILNNLRNKMTVVSFNPFVNNDLPNEIKGYFEDESKFDRVCMSIGLGQVEVLVQ